MIPKIELVDSCSDQFQLDFDFFGYLEKHHAGIFDAPSDERNSERTRRGQMIAVKVHGHGQSQRMRLANQREGAFNLNRGVACWLQIAGELCGSEGDLREVGCLLLIGGHFFVA